MNKHTLILSLLLTTLVLCACGGGGANTERDNAGQGQGSLNVSLLSSGTDIKTSGELLINLPMGMNRVAQPEFDNDSILVVVVHGYESRGYEWVTAVQNLTQEFGASYFYRYNWDVCPDEAAEDLNAAVLEVLSEQSQIESVLMFSHSYGGVVGARMAGLWTSRTPLESHLIAAPLAGYSRLLDRCTNLEYDKQDRLIYHPWQSNVSVIQHRTAHAQDGAFRDLAVDPQVINLEFDKIIDLPPTMDGHRLGHNWSVSWVVDSYLGKHHGF